MKSYVSSLMVWLTTVVAGILGILSLFWGMLAHDWEGFSLGVVLFYSAGGMLLLSVANYASRIAGRSKEDGVKARRTKTYLYTVWGIIVLHLVLLFLASEMR